MRGIFYSFPIQLLVLHIKNNQFLLFLWLLPVLMISGGFGRTYGIQDLFLGPEYLGNVNFWSFWWMGFTFGGFLMIWNITTYILYSYRFPFLASLNRPFAKFFLNNSLIPTAFIIFYLIKTINFQWYNELAAQYSIASDVFGFLVGLISMLLLGTLYFQLTNSDISILQKKFSKELPLLLKNRKDITDDPEEIFKEACHIDYYLSLKLQVRLVRNVEHYPIEWLHRVFRQNHQNAIISQLLSIFALFTMGLFMENTYLQIPAAGGIFIFSAVLMSLVGALSYWMGSWRTTAFILLLMGLNALSGLPVEFENRAYGLNYDTQKAPYNYAHLDSITTPDIIEKDRQATLKILEKWRSKFGRGRLIRQPKMVILCTSGGGIRQSVFTVHALQKMDSLLKGRLLEHTTLMTGASGGMIGAAYFREILLQSKSNGDINIYDPVYVDNAAKDLLNPVIFSILASDIFVPWLKFDYGGRKYYKDRGYIFERQLLENTDGVLEKNIAAYRQAEQDALIPMMVLTPVSAYNLRQVYISPLGVSYLTQPFTQPADKLNPEPDAVEFSRFFAAQDADSLRFTSALRMNATFPYILPNAYLPSEPPIRMIDAGWRDNYGVLAASRFVLNFSDWILENTSGVLIVQMRDIDKLNDFGEGTRTTIAGRLLNPLGTAASTNTGQDYRNDNQLNAMIQALGKDKVDVIELVYRPEAEEKRASVSWHITPRSKIDVINSFYEKGNQESMRQLEELVK